MRWALTACLLVVLGQPVGAGPASAEEPPQADRQAADQVIRDQLAAFQRDDAPAAFAFASPNIQTMFDHDPVRFLAMVREGYPPVYRPHSTAFGEATLIDGQIVQKVQLEGPDGVAQTAVYTLEREQDGHWRISGCVLEKSDALGA